MRRVGALTLLTCGLVRYWFSQGASRENATEEPVHVRELLSTRLMAEIKTVSNDQQHK